MTKLDKLYLQRTYELANRTIGNTAPNPPVGAVVVRDGRLLGEGVHQRAGAPHAETNALAQAGHDARGATIYVSLEPCRHAGRTPPCTQSLIAAGIARAVIGTQDPTPHGGGAAELRGHGIEVVVANDAAAADLIEMFSVAAVRQRPYVALKMAMSLDGMVASQSGVAERLGSMQEEHYVHELRTMYDAVMIGAATVRVDNSRLTVRPSHDRLRAYVRVVACQSEPLEEAHRVFSMEEGYERTIVLVPSGMSGRFEALRGVAYVVEVGESTTDSLDLREAMRLLRERGICSVLCEGGPRLGAALLENDLVDRLFWAITPRFLQSGKAVPVLRGRDLRNVRLQFDRVQRLGPDVLISAMVGGRV